MLFHRLFSHPLFLAALLPVTADAGSADTSETEQPAPAPAIRIEVEEARTRVMLASVILRVEELRPGDSGSLEGVYEVEVPDFTSKNDRGRLTLDLPRPFELLLKEGGTLEGKGVSELFPDDPPRRIVCRLIPPSGEDRPGRLRLAIQTSERVMRFETNFRVVPEPGGINESP